MNAQEIEAKFYVRNLKAIEARLRKLEAGLIQPRVLEFNLRFDTPDGSLRREKKVLRLRRDTETHLTYKGLGVQDKGVLSRREIEFTASDFDTARSFLEALGYQVVATYEKFRTIYEMGAVHIMLDELPYGDFVEIEGATSVAIRDASAKLDLDFGAAVPTSYLGLFERLYKQHGLDPIHLTFEALRNIRLDVEELSVCPADE